MEPSFRHGDLLPFPHCMYEALPCRGRACYLQQRLRCIAGREDRVRESSRSVNALGSATARSGLTIVDPPTRSPSVAQVSALLEFDGQAGLLARRHNGRPLRQSLLCFSQAQRPLQPGRLSGRPLGLIHLKLLDESPEHKPTQHRLSSVAWRLWEQLASSMGRSAEKVERMVEDGRARSSAWSSMVFSLKNHRSSNKTTKHTQLFHGKTTDPTHL